MTDAPEVPDEIVRLVEKLHRAAIGLGPSTRAPAVAALLTATIATALREARERALEWAAENMDDFRGPEGMFTAASADRYYAAGMAALGRGTEEGP